MRVVAALGLVALLAACASGGAAAGSGEGPPLEELVAESEGRSTVGLEDVRIWRDDVSVTMAVPATLDEIMQVIPAVYRSLEIPVAVHDLDRAVVGSPDWQPRRIAGERPTNFFRCGSGNSMTSHGASYAYRVSVETRARAGEGNRTIVETRVSSSARPRDVSGTEVRCTSRQRLENAINGAIVGALEKAARERGDGAEGAGTED